MTPIIILEEIAHKPLGEIAQLEASNLAYLLKEAQEGIHKAQILYDWVHGALTLKYRKQEQEERSRLQKPFGIIHLEDRNMRVSCTLPKRPVWHQGLLEQCIKEFQAEGIDPHRYIQVHYNVSEREFPLFPPNVRHILEQARTLKEGKRVYHFNPL